LSAVAPAASAALVKARTFAGCDTVTDSVNPRNPAVGSSDARNRTWEGEPKASA
jgi:hypothetical protein